MSQPRELADQMAAFGRAYTRWLHVEMERAAETTPARAQLLWVLHREGALKMSELSDRLGVTARNVTKLVDALEQGGLIARQADPEDRRVTRVRLSPEGQLKCKETMLAHGAASELYEELTEEDRNVLSRLIGKLQEGLQKRGYR